MNQRLRDAGITMDQPLVVLHVSAGNPFRRWPEEFFAETAAALAIGGPRRRIVLSSGPSDREAAARIATAIPVDHLRFSPATTGRVNIFSTVNGLFRASPAVVDRLNRIDPAITLACLKDHAEVKAGDMEGEIHIFGGKRLPIVPF